MSLERRKFAVKIVLGLLILFTLAFWGKEIKSGFFGDDFDTHLYLFNKAKSSSPIAVIQDLFSGVTMVWYRPLADLAYYLKFLFFGNDPTGYMIVGIFMHLLSSVLVFWLVFLLFGNKYSSLLSATLFCFFFRNYVVAKWIQTQTRLVTPLILLSLIMYLHFRRSNRVFYYALSIISFLLALLSQENALVLPFLVVITYLYTECKFDLSRLDLKKNRAALFFIGIYFITGILYFSLVFGFHLGGVQNPVNPPVQDFFNVAYFFVGIVVPFNVGKLKWDLHHLIDTGEFMPLLRTILFDNWHLVLVGLVVGFFIIFTVYHWRKNSGVLYGIVWFCISIAPFIPFTGNANRYFYIPSIGFSIVVVLLLNRIKNNHLKYALSILIIVLNIFILNYELRYWNQKHRQQVELGNMLKKDYPRLGEYDIVFWDDTDVTRFLNKYEILRVKRTLQYLQMERSRFLEFPPYLEITTYISSYIIWLYGYPSLKVYRVGRDVTEEEIKNIIRGDKDLRYIYLSYDGQAVTQGVVNLNE